MPYLVQKRKGPRPFKIIRKIDGKVVGSSVSRMQARHSVSHRMEAETSRKPKT